MITEDYGEEAVKVAADSIADRMRSVVRSRRSIGVILGSGLGYAAQRMLQQTCLSIPYCEIPGMPVPLVPGHAGHLLIGNCAGATVFMLKGRVHFYEGHSLAAVTFATRVLYQLGVTDLILTNAAGGIRPEFRNGHLMLISGHIEWPSMNLSCVAATPRGPRSVAGTCRVFQDWGTPPVGWPHSNVWSPSLKTLASGIACELTIHEGVYALMSGPNYETPAEVRAARFLGADAVGMSTVPEAMAASQRGMSVLGVSCITNIASGLSDQKLDHADVTQTTASVEHRFSAWLWEVVEQMANGPQD